MLLFSLSFILGCTKSSDDDIINTYITKNLLTATVKGIAHRGFSSVAPENTLPSYKLAKEMGFAYVETDVRWTKDNIPVIIHDDTVDRTSNGTGKVEDITLTNLKNLDFGSWKDIEYSGTIIPTFEEFIFYCKQLNLHPYIELKSAITTDRTTLLIDIVKKAGMINNVTWISFNFNNLNLILENQPTARCGYSEILDYTVILKVINIKTSINNVFILAKNNSITDNLAKASLLEDIPIEAWTIDESDEVLRLVNKGVSGIITNRLNIEDVLNN